MNDGTSRRKQAWNAAAAAAVAGTWHTGVPNNPKGTPQKLLLGVPAFGDSVNAAQQSGKSALNRLGPDLVYSLPKLSAIYTEARELTAEFSRLKNSPTAHRSSSFFIEGPNPDSAYMPATIKPGEKILLLQDALSSIR